MDHLKYYSNRFLTINFVNDGKEKKSKSKTKYLKVSVLPNNPDALNKNLDTLGTNKDAIPMLPHMDDILEIDSSTEDITDVSQENEHMIQNVKSAFRSEVISRHQQYVGTLSTDKDAIPLLPHMHDILEIDSSGEDVAEVKEDNEHMMQNVKSTYRSVVASRREEYRNQERSSMANICAQKGMENTKENIKLTTNEKVVLVADGYTKGALKISPDERWYENHLEIPESPKAEDENVEITRNEKVIRLADECESFEDSKINYSHETFEQVKRKLDKNRKCPKISVQVVFPCLPGMHTPTESEDFTGNESFLNVRKEKWNNYLAHNIDDRDGISKMKIK